jgi:putative transposase
LNTAHKRQFVANYIRKNSTIPLRWLASAIGLSPKSFTKRKNQPREIEDAVWKQRIEAVLMEFPRYGYRMMRPALIRNGYFLGKHKLQRLMQKFNLTQKHKKRSWKTTDSKHRLPIYPNLIKDIIPSFPFHIWAADITYVRLPKGFCYCAAIIDVFTRKIVGWAMMDTLEAILVVEALRMALKNGTPQYHHSDRGKQYCSKEYTGILKARGVKISMAAVGMSVDNAYAESFFRILKVDEVYIADYQTLEEARVSIQRFIERIYNQKRLHSSLGYVPPAEFEEAWLQKHKGRVSLVA